MGKFIGNLPVKNGFLNGIFNDSHRTGGWNTKGLLNVISGDGGLEIPDGVLLFDLNDLLPDDLEIPQVTFDSPLIF